MLSHFSNREAGPLTHTRQLLAYLAPVLLTSNWFLLEQDEF